MKQPILNRNQTELPGDGWHQIEVSGEHPAGKGRKQLIDDLARAAIVENFRLEAEEPGFSGMLVDLDHLSHDLANSTEAYAWLHEVEDRDGQLWGRMEWTDLGQAAIKNKRLKWFSTEYPPDALEEVSPGVVRPLRLDGLALTNRPNNKGGKPIVNRKDGTDGTDPSGEQKNSPADSSGSEEKNDKPNNMKTIAEKLGLPAEASEEQILAAIGELQSKYEGIKNKQAEAEVEEILNRNAKRIPDGQRDAWKGQLICNRAGAEALLAGLPERAEKAAPERIHNRSAAGSPEGAAVEAKDADKASRLQAETVAAIRNRDNTTYATAWETARREKPELF